MSWQSEFPKEPGFYWVWLPENYDAPRMILFEVHQDLDGGYEMGSEIYIWRESSDLEGWRFLGPLAQPEPPEEK